jgi:acid phosphatase (class A)
MAAIKALALSALVFTPVAVRADPSPAEGVSLDPAPLERVVGTPPAARSAEAGQDLAVLLWLQQARTPEIVSSSWTLLERNPTAFSRALGVDMGRTTPRLNAALKAFLKPVDGIKDQIKDRVNRPRPFVSHPQIIPCLPLETTASFPSGHSTWFRAASELLADLLPERRSRLLELGRHGGNSRVLCGMHYPSDVEAGQRLGVAAANQLIQSPQWRAFKADPAVQAELDQVRKAPASALPVLVH